MIRSSFFKNREKINMLIYVNNDASEFIMSTFAG